MTSINPPSRYGSSAEPIATVAPRLTAMPSSTLTRGPSLVPIPDARNWPTEYDSRYAAQMFATVVCPHSGWSSITEFFAADHGLRQK